MKKRYPHQFIQAMDWKKANKYSSFHFFYTHLMYMRQHITALIEGDFIPLYSNPDVLAYLRYHNRQIVLVILNRGEDDTITFSLPPNTFTPGQVLQSEQGPLPRLALTGDTLTLNILKENTYIFLS